MIEDEDVCHWSMSSQVSLPTLKVSLMLEEGFAAAARLNTMGFPVGVQLASRLVPDVTYFLSTYVDSVS